MARAATKSYVNLLSRRYEDDDEGLRLAAQQVADTMASPGWQVIRELLDVVQTDYYSNSILGHASIHGVIPSQAEFARATGFLAGLEQPQIAADAFESAFQAMRARNDTHS